MFDLEFFISSLIHQFMFTNFCFKFFDNKLERYIVNVLNYLVKILILVGVLKYLTKIIPKLYKYVINLEYSQGNHLTYMTFFFIKKNAEFNFLIYYYVLQFTVFMFLIRFGNIYI